MNTLYNLAFFIVLATIIKISYNPKDISNISEIISEPDGTITKNIEEPENIIPYETIEEKINIIHNEDIDEKLNIIHEEIIKEILNIIQEENIQEPINIIPEIIINDPLPSDIIHVIIKEKIKKISPPSVKIVNVDEANKSGWCCSSYYKSKQI